MNAQTPPSVYLSHFDHVLVEKPLNDIIPITLLSVSEFDEFQTRAALSFTRQMEQADFKATHKQFCVLRNDAGMVVEILIGLQKDKIGIYDLSHVFEKIRTNFSSDFLSSVCFKINIDLDLKNASQAALGWALASYKFDLYKKEKTVPTLPVLIWPINADKDRVIAMAQALCLVKTLINMPANKLGTDELADAAAHIAKLGKAKFSRIVDKDLIDHNFPMIYEVGKASTRRPQLVDITYGDESHPAITLVGKGVVFDTGGLDLKPPAFMGLMKKDMGGAAHVLGLAHIIMFLKLPVRLRVLIAIAENSVSGDAFRPGDIIQSRKGLSVEIGDTDAEGRLVVADALTYACDDSTKPSLIIDFCTLTGSARAALGYDIPAFFSNNDALLDELRDAGKNNEDPVWPLPLYHPYLKEMKSPIADLNNIGSGKAGAIHGALFLHEFIDQKIDWIHVDCYAWEQSGKAGRPQGGADTGLRAVFALIEDKFLS